MQKLIQGINHIKNLFFALLISISAVTLCPAQVSITDNNPHEIRFSKNQSTTDNSLIVLSISDIINELTGDEPSEIQLNGSEMENEYFYFVEDESQYISPARIQPSESNETTLFSVSLINETGFGLENMMVAFDFLYKLDRISNNYNLTLQYRVNDEIWMDAKGGSVSTRSFSENSDEWDTFSIQLNLNDIFLRPNDAIDLRWVLNSDEIIEIESRIPIALQRVEIYPERAVYERIPNEGLIITEIFPKFVIDEMEFEYIELFNASEYSVSLKGMELHTSSGVKVIQRELEIHPYSMAVISNLDISDIEGVNTLYTYNATFLTPLSGRVEIIRDNELITRATYESQEGGQALELDRMSNAMNGYTSLQNLVPSNGTIYSDLKGTPGFFGNTIPMFTKTLSREGWYIISPPGILTERLNRHPNIEYFDLSGNNLTIDQIDFDAPIAIYKTGDQPVTLYAEPFPVSGDDLGINLATSQEGFRYASFSTPQSSALWTVGREGDLPMPPVVQVWDENSQTFNLQFTASDRISFWSPFIINSDIDDALTVNSDDYSSDLSVMERYIPLSIYEGSGNSRLKLDEAVIGFLDLSNQTRSERFDLPKLNGSFQREYRLPQRSSLYLTTPISKYRANSFIQMPYNPDQASSVGVGFEPQSGSSGYASLEWNLNQEIPEEWTLKLEDTHTGNSVDMREVNNYRFRYTSQSETDQTDVDANGLRVINPVERNRFVISIEPFESIVESETEEEKPGSIELRQNYPNPFNPSTNITFYLPEERAVRVGVYNIVGQQVSLLIDETLQSGEHSVVWDATNNPSGIYIVQLETGSRILTRKITLIK